MASEGAGRPADGNAYTRFFDRVDHALEPIFGAPPIGEDSEPVDPAELAARPCPVCGHPISEHTFAESSGNVLMECPTDERLPERAANEPLNELGMPSTGERLERQQARQAEE